MRRPRSWWAVAGLGGVLLASAGTARGDTEDDDACPEVFGGDTARARNALLRELSFELLESSDGHIAIVHSGEWSAPTPLRFDGVELVDVDTRAQSATLRVDLANVCTGTYRVARDDDIGASARIIAVAEDALVVVHRGVLRYLAREGSTPDIELVWSSGWSMTPRTVAGRAPPLVVPRK